MVANKLITLPNEVNPGNFADAMQQAIALELATIPTYLSTYYSINRAQDQDALYNKLRQQLGSNTGDNAAQVDALAQELKVDVLVYANKTAALIMSVVIEEMLHLALACNVKQALAGPPDLMSISQALVFPTQLDGHDPEFPINAAKLSLQQLSTFLQIESPQPFQNPPKLLGAALPIENYETIGQLYTIIKDCITKNYQDPKNYSNRPQLLPPQKPSGPTRPYYSQNSVNTVYYDRAHNPVFASSGDSGALIGVVSADSAIEAIEEIMHQGEGNMGPDQTVLQFGPDRLPIPLPVVDGEVQFKPGDYDDSHDHELSHFAKFMEVYSLGRNYQEKFAQIGCLDNFFSYFVFNQASNPKQADYDAVAKATGSQGLALSSKLGNATFTYILLMIEACYYADESTQFQVFMYGIHKSMIWLLSGVGHTIRSYNYTSPTDGQTYAGALTFEYFDFAAGVGSPKEQMLGLVQELAIADPTNWGWMADPKYDGYWPSLPDVSLDHRVVPNVPAIPA